MRFPEISPHTYAVRATAVQHLDDAREAYTRLAGLATAAAGTAAGPESADLRDAARARVLAGEAWVGYVEHAALSAWPGVGLAGG